MRDVSAEVPAAVPADVRADVAKRLPTDTRLSTGLRTWLAGPPDGGSGDRAAPATPSFGSNVDANDPARDRAGGQSETAIAAQRTAVGQSLVMAGWNDISGYFSLDTTTRVGSLTGVGISRDGGRHVTDLIGLPNSDPGQQWMGDPSIAALGDGSHFAISSLYYPSLRACARRPAAATIAVTIATVDSRTVSFSPPVRVGNPGDICQAGNPTPPKDLGVLDKGWISYDRSSRTLAVSYTRLFLMPGPPPPDEPPPPPGPLNHSGLGQVEVVRATLPSNPATLTSAAFGPPAVVWPEEPYCPEAARCGAVNTGAYVAVAPGGTAYVGWERNIDTNVFGEDPSVYIHLARVAKGFTQPSMGGPRSPVVVSVGQPNATRSGGVKSLDTVPIAGYSRGPGNDFPRVVIDAPSHRVLVEWNDASWLRAAPMSLGALGPPAVRVNDDDGYALHFLPALSVRTDGTICSSWYDRRRGGGSTSGTDYYGECRADPMTNATDFRITTGSTDWSGTSSLINPNFGDYTDNATDGSRTYFAWTDGRVGVPQPFVDSR